MFNQFTVSKMERLGEIFRKITETVNFASKIKKKKKVLQVDLNSQIYYAWTGGLQRNEEGLLHTFHKIPSSVSNNY